MARTIVILGANYTGVPIAHYLLKHTAANVKDLKVVVVAPNTHMYWFVASVRGILPNMLADDHLFLPLAPEFAKYPSDNVIATGSSFKNDMPFKNLSSTDDTKRTLHEWAQRISEAKSIVVAGGGLTGVELAGELGQEYASTGKKEITLICDKDLPLEPRLRRDVRETAKNELERFKVKVITNARASSSPSSNIITLTPTKSSPSTSEKAAAKIPRTLSADLFIPAFGTIPNTSFLPASMLDDRGHVKTTPTLRAQGHDNIFVVGDAGNLQVTQGVYADAQAVYLAKLLDARALGNGREAQLPPYKPDDKIMVGVSLGKNSGVGQMGGWKLWGWMIAMFKSKKLGTQYFPAFVRGDRTILVKKNW